MSSLSQRLHLGVQQKQILTPGLVQMVTVLQLNRMELKDMIMNEIAENPVLEEASEAGDELTPAEVQSILERESLTDGPIVDRPEHSEADRMEAGIAPVVASDGDFSSETAMADTGAQAAGPEELAKTQADPFDEIDFGSFFDDYLDPGFKSPASESVEKPSFETFLSSPVTLSDHLQSQLSHLILPDRVRDAAITIIGNLEDNGYLGTPIEEIAAAEGLTLGDLERGLQAVQSLDPSGIGALDLRHCLLLQLQARGSKDSVAWKIVHDHFKLLATRQFSQLGKVLGRPVAHIQIALAVIRQLNPDPGLRYSDVGARQVEPDVYISKDGDDYVIMMTKFRSYA